MNDEKSAGSRHESVDDDRPTNSWPTDDPGDEVPGTDIMGDETLVRSTGDGPPGIVPGPSGGTGSAPDAGPTPEAAKDQPKS